MTEPRPRVEAAVADLAADLREWIAWTEETGAVELPAFERPAQQRQPVVQPTRTPASGPPPATATRPTPAQRPQQPRHGGARIARAPERAPGGSGQSLEQIRAALGPCERCPLHAGRRNIVFGVGSPVAELMLIGEGPGRDEDLTGEPFVGRSGQLLTRMLAAIGLDRGDVYIANVVKCRPPRNRDPEPNEVATCSPFLHQQIQAIRPRVIMTLGRFASQNIVGIEASMGELRRQVRAYQQTPVVATYHPAYLLRNPIAKRQSWGDFLKVRALLRGI